MALAYASGIKAAVLDGLDLQTLELRSPAEPDQSIRVVRAPGDGDATIVAVQEYVLPPGADLLAKDFSGLPAFELDSDGTALVSSPNLAAALGGQPLAPSPTSWSAPSVVRVRLTPEMARAGLPWAQVDLACSATFTTEEFDQADSPTPAIQQLGEHTRLRFCVLIDPAARSVVSREVTTRDALLALAAALLVGSAVSLLPIPALRPRLLLSRR